VDRLFSDPKKFSALKAANVERLVSAIFPHSDIAELRVMILFMLWMHAWDDEVDNSEGEYAKDLGAAQAFSEDTLHAAEFHLGLSMHQKPTALNRIIDTLEEIGGHFREVCSRGGYYHPRRLVWSLIVGFQNSASSYTMNWSTL
jgi:hypothetical protein